VGNEGVTKLLESSLVFEELCFLGFDLVFALTTAKGVGRRSQPRNLSATSAAPTGDDGDAPNLSPKALQYNLDSLPLNVLIISLSDGHYLLPETAALMRRPATTAVGTVGGEVASNSRGTVFTSPGKGSLGNVGSSSSTGSSGGVGSSSSSNNSNGAFHPSTRQLGKHNLGSAFDGIYRLMQLGRDTGEAERQRSEALKRVAEVLSGVKRGESCVGVGEGASNGSSLAGAGNVFGADNLSPLTSSAARILELKKRILEVSSEGAALEKKCVTLETRLVGVRASSKAAAASMADTAALLPGMEQELEEAAAETQLLRSLLTAKQLSLLSELKVLYPIKESDGGTRYTIRGIHLPNGDGASLLACGAPEEQIATALGYTAHAVFLASKYLGVPLRYACVCMASHSCIRDEVGGQIFGGHGVGGDGVWGGFMEYSSWGGLGHDGGLGGSLAPAFSGGLMDNYTSNRSVMPAALAPTPSFSSSSNSNRGNFSGGSSSGGGISSSSSLLAGGGTGGGGPSGVGGTKLWPLYWKNNADREGLKVGYKLLTRNVQQLLASQGIQFQDQLHILALFGRLFNVLLDANV